MGGDHVCFAGHLEKPSDLACSQNRGADGTVAVVTEEWLGTGHVQEGKRAIGVSGGLSERRVVFFFQRRKTQLGTPEIGIAESSAAIAGEGNDRYVARDAIGTGGGDDVGGEAEFFAVLFVPSLGRLKLYAGHVACRDFDAFE